MFFNAGAGEDVAALESALGVSMFTWLGGRDFDELARLCLEHGVAAFAECGCLGWEGKGGVCVAACLGMSVAKEKW